MSELKDLNSDKINLISDYNSILEESNSSDDSDNDQSKVEVKLLPSIKENLID